MIIIFLISLFGLGLGSGNINLKNILDSKNYLKKQFWITNYGLNLDIYHSKTNIFLDEVNNDIIYKSLRDIEDYRIKYPTDALFNFRKDNKTGTYTVSSDLNEIKINDLDIRLNSVIELDKYEDKKQKTKLKRLIIYTRNKLNSFIKNLNNNIVNVLKKIELKYNNTNMVSSSSFFSFFNHIFGNLNKKNKIKELELFNNVLEELKLPFINCILLQKTLKELYLLTNSNILLENSYINSNFYFWCEG